MNLIEKAQIYSHAAHDAVGQVRKYTGEPYWVHTDAVANLVTMAIFNYSFDRATNMIAAAYLHDSLEDTKITRVQILKEFGPEVASLVDELTDRYTKEAFPDIPRFMRKQLEAARLATISPYAQTIKYADLLDNTVSIVENDLEFAKVYLKEKADILAVMDKGHPDLYKRVKKQLAENLIKLWKLKS